MDGEMNGWLNGWMNGRMNANDEDKAAAPTTSASQAYSIGTCSVGMIVSFMIITLVPSWSVQARSSVVLL